MFGRGKSCLQVTLTHHITPHPIQNLENSGHILGQNRRRKQNMAKDVSKKRGFVPRVGHILGDVFLDPP